MYGNLLIEMKRRKITQTAMAEHLGITTRGLNLKVRGHSDFTAPEMFAIQREYFPDLTLEYLFEKK